jgi:molybdopterin-containing oxidoreductase family membrane subunit
VRSEAIVVGRYTEFSGFVSSLRKLREMGYGKKLDAYSPVPRHEIDEALSPGPSEVRYFTLTGCLLGLIAGATLTVTTSLLMNMVTGGKPVISIPPFIIIMFELTILFGGLVTFLGFLARGRLPFFRVPRAWDDRFSGDVFGIVVPSSREESEKLARLMKELGASEVKIE